MIGLGECSFALERLHGLDPERLAHDHTRKCPFSASRVVDSGDTQS